MKPTRLWLLAAMAALLGSGTGRSQEGAAAVPITVSSSLPADGFIGHDAPVVLTLSRDLAPADGTVSVMAGATDLSAVFRVEGTRLSFTPGAVRLPAGETQLVVSLASAAGGAREIGRFPLRVLTARGFKRAQVRPRLDVGLKAQVAEGHDPESTVLPRGETYQTGTLQGSLDADLARDRWTFRGSVRVAGSSYANEALRFATEGDDAPKVDLAGYQATFELSPLTLTVGELFHGSHRYLLDGFASRGLRLHLRLGPAVDAALLGASGRTIVGYGNLLGFQDADQRVAGAFVGVEAFPSRPGALRLEASTISGTVLPLPGFTQGAVVDSEESRGLGLRLTASDPRQRLRIDAGYARSRLDLREDVQLAGGLALLGVGSDARDAGYASVMLDVVRDRPVGTAGNLATVTVGIVHDRVDPLYRSVVAPAVQPDRARTLGSLGLQSGDLMLRIEHGVIEDNLDDLASVLSTSTRQTTANLALPLARFFGGSPWAPLVTGSYLRIHQEGDGIPENGEFQASHVPDQISSTSGFGLQWQGTWGTLAYRLDRSSQDNRQPGREQADLDNLVNGLNLSWTISTWVDGSIDVAVERARNREQDRIDHLRRLGLMLNVRLPRGFSLAGTLTGDDRDDDAGQSSGRNLNGELGVAWSFRPARRGFPSGQLFLRYATQSSDARDTVFGIDESRDAWQAFCGLNLSFF